MADSFINILTSLEVDNQPTRKNINDYIKNLKDLPSIKVSLEIDGTTSLKNDFGDVSKVIKDLQSDVAKLKNELGSLGGNSLSGSIKSFNNELSKSYSSLDDLEKKVKSLGGSLKVVTEKGILPSGMESDSVAKYVDAQFKDAQGLLRNQRFKVDLDFFGGIQGLNQIKESISNVDFKNFDTKAQRTQDVLNRLARQGNLTTDQLKDLQNQLNALSSGNRSVSELEALNREIKNLGDNASQAKKFENAMANINSQVEPLIMKLQEFNKIDGLDKIGLNRVISDLSRIQNVDIKTDQQLKEVNLQFKNVEKSVKDFVKEADRIKKVNNDIAKLEDSIEKLVNKGSLSREQADGFLIDTQLINKTTDAVKMLENQINKVASSTDLANKINNALATISPNVDRLNEKLSTTVNKLGENIDVSKLQNVQDKIQQISNTQLTTDADIKRLNTELVQTERLITQLGTSAQATNQFENAVRKAEQALDKLEKTGYSSVSNIERLREELNRIPTGELDTVRRLVSQIDDELKSIGNDRSVSNSIQQLTRDVQVLENQLERTMIQHKNTFDPKEAERLKQEINGIRTALASLPKTDVPTEEFDRLSNGIANARVELQQFNNQTLKTSGSLSGLIANLDETFLKFAVWTGISGVIFGVGNAVQDLVEKVVELNTALVGLQRVADADSFEFNTIIERAIDNVGELSGKTTEYLEILNEFARQGNTLNEALDLTDTTQILTNISDLDAAGATDALIASMVNFNVTAERSIEIADKLNEVNYSPLLW